jgi:hypothetical protein
MRRSFDDSEPIELVGTSSKVVDNENIYLDLIKK